MSTMSSTSQTLDQLAVHAARLARQNEALDDLTGIVAHEVKSALLHALLSDEPRPGLRRALELVDTILDAFRASQADDVVVAADRVVQQTLADLGPMKAKISSSATGSFPLPPAALRVVTRNLLANALAAGADNIHVSTLACGTEHLLVVDDDGIGLDAQDGYDTGGQIGLTLCRRLVARFGGIIELKPRTTAGTRAVVSVGWADR
jgi:signal transduction histidine kinase